MFKLTLSFIFLIILYLPLAQAVFHFAPEPELYGAIIPAEKPILSFKNWLDGDLQKKAENFYDQKIGFRNALIKTDNQFNYWLFNETYQKTQSPLIIGKENYLYEKNYLETFLGRDLILNEQLEDRIKNLKKLQDRLKEQKIPFLFIIAPIKTSVYPEYLPKKYLAMPTDLNNYTQIILLLEKYKINYWDGRAYFLENKSSSPYPLFPKGGTHWSYYGACLADYEILTELKLKSNLINCAEVNIENSPQGRDKDLAELINLWNIYNFNEKLAYPKNNPELREKSNLNALIVGDSFVWNLLNYFNFKSYDFYYYFNSNSALPKKESSEIKKDPNNLKEAILKHNLVIIEASESALNDIGFGFINSALNALNQ